MGAKKKKYPVEHMDVTVESTTVSDGVSKNRSSEISHYKESHVEKLVHALERFLIDHPDTKQIHEFYYAHNISRTNYYSLLDKWPKLKEAHEKTMAILGGRLWSRAVDFKGNWNAIKFMLHTYSPDYSSAKEYEAMLSAKAKESIESSSGPQIVVIEKFPDSEIVKEKKK